MRTFAELLREYTERTGVSDAELARAIGVQRQTVFRWKEGTVGRPRLAEDVVRLAAKLRLTDAERDELLLAAGFPPVAAPVAAPSAEMPAAEPHSADLAPTTRAAAVDIAAPVAEPVAPPQHKSRRWRPAALIGLIVLVFAVFAVALVIRDRARYPRAATGETLVVVAQFGNYTGGNQGYNVAGRLNEALERELRAAGLQGARSAVWPAAVFDAPSAAQALVASGAALLIWGEYDSGRVVARFLPRSNLAVAARELSLLAASPADLPTVINSALPGDIRYLALYSLAQIYLADGAPALARSSLGQAGVNLPADPATRAAHYFLWGYTNQIMEGADLNVVIQAYTDALKLDDQLAAAYNNRAVAYLGRQAPGDPAAAVADLTRYLDAHDEAGARNNRGTAYFLLGGAENLGKALLDFDRAIDLAPGEPVSYFNRGLVYVRLDDGPKWRADLEAALAGGETRANEGLCWGYALSEQPAQAIAPCRAATEVAKDIGSWENLGIAYARMGEYGKAITALETYRARLVANGGSTKIQRVDAWLSALKAGRNPVDAEMVRGLREE